MIYLFLSYLAWLPIFTLICRKLYSTVPINPLEWLLHVVFALYSFIIIAAGGFLIYVLLGHPLYLVAVLLSLLFTSFIAKGIPK